MAWAGLFNISMQLNKRDNIRGNVQNESGKRKTEPRMNTNGHKYRKAEAEDLKPETKAKARKRKQKRDLKSET
jgi:hypothetical protein